MKIRRAIPLTGCNAKTPETQQLMKQKQFMS